MTPNKKQLYEKLNGQISEMIDFYSQTEMRLPEFCAFLIMSATKIGSSVIGGDLTFQKYIIEAYEKGLKEGLEIYYLGKGSLTGEKEQ